MYAQGFLSPETQTELNQGLHVVLHAFLVHHILRICTSGRQYSPQRSALDSCYLVIKGKYGLHLLIIYSSSYCSSSFLDYAVLCQDTFVCQICKIGSELVPQGCFCACTQFQQLET